MTIFKVSMGNSLYTCGPFSWSQEGPRLWMNYGKGAIYWDMPEGWLLSETHPSLLKLSEMIFTREANFLPDELHCSQREKGSQIGLLFSGGVDSQAARALSPPDTHLIYIDSVSLPWSERQRILTMLSTMENVTVVSTNMWEAGSVLLGERPRAPNGHCIFIPSILVSDYLNLGTIALGDLLGTSYLGSFGSHYAGEVQIFPWRKNREACFNVAGLSVSCPILGCSEIISNTIMSHVPLRESHWCNSGMFGEKCLKCLKCYRKSMIQGTVLTAPPWLLKKLQEKKSLYMGHTLIHAAKKLHIQDDWLKPFMNLQTEFLEYYYEPYLDCIPIKYRAYAKEKLHQYGIKRMTKEHVSQMRAWDIR